MAIAREPGMTAAEFKDANAAVTAARTANNKPAAAPKATPYNTGTAYNPLSGMTVAPYQAQVPKKPLVKKIEKPLDTGITTQVQGLLDIIAKLKEELAKLKDEKPKDEKPTLAFDTFKNTYALIVGSKEADELYVEKLYKLTKGYFDTGSTIDESINLALYDAEKNKLIPEFTERFEGIFKLRDMLKAGNAITVPTIAEFIKSEAELGQVMIRAGFSDLANQKFLGGILGLGKSVKEITALIDETFKSIDNAPEALKRDLQSVAPGADRTSIARALLLGKEGAAALNKQIAATSVFSAFKSQNLNIDMSTAGDYAARGYNYAETLKSAGEVATAKPTYQKLTEISTGKKVESTDAQLGLQKAIFEKNLNEQQKIDEEAKKEIARFSASPGTAGSRSLASSNRANRRT